MEVQIAVAKVNKYAVSESGDTLEVVERPMGAYPLYLQTDNLPDAAQRQFHRWSSEK
jgi:hypothetical protein